MEYLPDPARISCMVKMGMSENKQYRPIGNQFPEPLRKKCTQHPDSGIDQNGLLPFCQQKNVASAGHYPDNFCSVPGSPCFETGKSLHVEGKDFPLKKSADTITEDKNPIHTTWECAEIRFVCCFASIWFYSGCYRMDPLGLSGWLFKSRIKN
jgi:hypothetical protein